jgi:hypothetical protein
VFTIRRWSASKSSRSPVHTTNSPFILSRLLCCAVLLGSDRCGHVHNGVVDLVAAAPWILVWARRDTVAVGNRPPGLAGPFQLELARAAERLPGEHGMPGGSRYELKWDGFLY